MNIYIYRSIGLSLEGVRILNWNRQSNTAPMTRWRGARNPFAGTCALAAVACYKAGQHEAGLLKRGHRFALESRVSVNRWDAEPLVVALHHTIARGNYRRIKQLYIHTYIHIHTHSCIYIYNWYVVRSLVILACWHRFQSHSATKYVRPGTRFQVFNLWDEAEETYILSGLELATPVV